MILGPLLSHCYLSHRLGIEGGKDNNVNCFGIPWARHGGKQDINIKRCGPLGVLLLTILKVDYKKW